MPINNVEIGSEFWDVPTKPDYQNNILPDNTSWFLSGRTALREIIKDIKSKIKFESAALPSWCCESMILPFVEEQISVKFYSVYKTDNGIEQNFHEAENCDVILKMDYFGYQSTSPFSFDKIVISDITHSIFCSEVQTSQYTFGSLRKWAGFFTGGFAFSKNHSFEPPTIAPNDEYVTLRKEAMQKKKTYIEENKGDKAFLNDFAAAERYLDECTQNMGAHALDIQRAKTLDIDSLRAKRRKNAFVLLNELSDFAIFPCLNENDCPLFVPLYIDDGKRDDLRKYLISKQIYCPIHWPVSKLHKVTDLTAPIYKNEISLVCDQRYTPSDMYRIAEEVKTFLSMR